MVTTDTSSSKETDILKNQINMLNASHEEMCDNVLSKLDILLSHVFELKNWIDVTSYRHLKEGLYEIGLIVDNNRQE